jgi:hypothetical protein
MLIIYIIGLFYSTLHLSPFTASLVLTSLAVIATIAIVFLAYKVFRMSKRRWLLLLCALLLISCWVKWIPYFRWKDQVQVPEFVDKITVNDLPCSSCVFTYFKIGLPPFDVEPPYTYTLFVDEAEINEWIQSKTQDTDTYTYLIAYELNIDTVMYNVWNGENYPFPWYGPIMYPHYEMTAASPNELIIYRIPRVAIWNE